MDGWVLGSKSRKRQKVSQELYIDIDQNQYYICT
jgi:hypothetical protein